MNAFELVEPEPFAYSDLPESAAATVKLRTMTIRALVNRSGHDLWDIGRNLLSIRDLIPHGRFLAWLALEFPDWSEDTAQRLMRVARAFPEIPHGAVFAMRALTELARPSTPEEARAEARELLESGEALTEKTAKKLSLKHRSPGMFTSNSDEWNTPSGIMSIAHAFMDFDLDPCSPGEGLSEVRAARHFTRADNGLAQDWAGRVWMNPPYGKGIEHWLHKLVSGYRTGAVPEALALLPSRTDTAWFQPLFRQPVCFLAGRLHFNDGDDGAFFGSALVYFGDRTIPFMDAFCDQGAIVMSPRELRGE